MGITRVKAFAGEAEVLGKLVEVEYTVDGRLQLEGLTLDEAYEALDKLSLKQITAVRVTGKTGPEAPKEAPPPKPSAPKKVATPLRAVPEEAPAPKASAPKAPKEAPAAEAPAAEAPSDAEGGIPEKVQATKRFIEAMDWVMKAKGLKPSQVDEIVAACEEVKGSITVLGRVRDIRDKVVSNLVAYEEAGNA